MQVGTLALIFALSLVSATAAQQRAEPPYVGSWKLNVAKSNFGGTMFTYESLPDGSMRSTRPGMSYVFRQDGKEYKVSWGVTTWQTVDATTWNQTSVTNDKTVFKAKIFLSPDGNTLTMDGTMEPPKGKPIRSVDVYRRISGGPGLVGQWGVSPTSVPATMEVKSSGADGLTIAIAPMSCAAQFDGKDYPMAFGTCALTRLGTTGVVMVEKVDGQEQGRLALSASADGKTLNAEYTLQDAKMSLLYERQR